ncbi:MAG: hypothetical protein KAH20_10520 [Methylococcales bacterium]|nr:hypothetical protein [Methylococcales bacterium]
MNVKKIKFTVLHVIVVFIPASIIFYFALNAGMLPDNDYWGFISHFLSEKDGFSSEISDWVKRDNEHYVLFPKIIYALNIIITNGNNIALSLFTWFMAMLQVLLLYHLIPFRPNQKPTLFLALLFVISLFIFSPAQSHNWFLGMSGVAWISANFFSLSAIYFISYYSATNQNKYIILTFLFSVFAVVTYSTSLSLFPTLIIASLLLPLRRKEQVAIFVFSITILGLYLSTYNTPPEHPSLNQPGNTLVSYFFIFIGSLFTRQNEVAIVVASLGIMSSLSMLLVIYKKQTYWKTILPWVFIQLYACGNAAMASLARSGFSVEQAFSSRYASLPALFWISWIMIATVFCNQTQKKYRQFAFIALIGASSIFIIKMYQIGFKVAVPHLERAKNKQITLAALYSHALDAELIHKTLIPNVSMVYIDTLLKTLEHNQHIPFNGIFNSCPEIGSQLTQIHNPINTQYFGRVDEIKLKNNEIFELRGWANNNNKDPVCIVFTNQDNIVRAIASYGISRPDIPKTIPSILSSQSGWHGYVKLNKSDKLIKVFMLSTFDQYWIPLTGYYQIIQQAPYFEKIDVFPS